MPMSNARQAEGKSVYNSYPSVEETEGRLARVRRLTRSGLFHLMYLVSGQTPFSENAASSAHDEDDVTHDVAQHAPPIPRTPFLPRARVHSSG
jgi:hypothetical protein